jgi:hypothetical protein
METEAVVESNDVLLEEVKPSSPTEIQLAQSIVNTRIVSQDSVYQIEDVTVETVHTIESFYLPDTDDVQRLQWIPETAELYSSTDNDDLQKSDVTIGELTSEHIGKEPNALVNRDITPIEPIHYETQDGEKQTLYFAEVETDSIAKIHLRDEDGDRQTVYKTSVDEDQEKLQNRCIGQTVEFEADEETVHLKNVPNKSIHSTENDSTSWLSKATAVADDLWQQQSRIVLLSIIGWLGLIVAYKFIESVTSSVATLIFMVSLLVLAMGVMSVVTNRSNDNRKAVGLGNSSANKLPFHQNNNDGSTSVNLEAPDSLDETHTTENPITNVDVTPEFKESSLVLTIDSVDNDICWKYRTNNDNVFVNDEIIDFYTELGFNNLEQSSFEAYVSTDCYPDQTPYLKTDTLRHNLYLYPEEPTPDR